MKIVIPGGSGQVGQILTRAFLKEGQEVLILSRSSNKSKKGRFVAWDAESIGPWAKELEGAEVLINLAGRSVNCRYNKHNQRVIKESRIHSTRILWEAIKELENPPRLWINASTATIYRHSLDKDMDEETGELGGNEPGAPPKWNFSIDVAKSWEDEFFKENRPNVRQVAIRSAMTMSPDKGGIFDVILGMVRVGLGGTNGSGKQYVSWVHEFDFVNAIKFIIDHEEIDGVINICSPNPLPNNDFLKSIRKAWGIPFGLPAFEWQLEIGAIFMRTETELILKSRRVVPGRLQKLGFEFQYPNWHEAANELCQRAKEI